MKSLISVMLVLTLLFSNVALASSSGARNLFRSNKVAGFVDKAKQLGTGLILAGILTCGQIGCTTQDVPSTKGRAASITLNQSNEDNIYQNTLGLNLKEEVIRNIEFNGDVLFIETSSGTFSLPVNNGDIVISSGSAVLASEVDDDLVKGWIVLLAFGTAVVGMATTSAGAVSYNDDTGNTFGTLLVIVTGYGITAAAAIGVLLVLH